jgi:hypothetical protein
MRMLKLAGITLWMGLAQVNPASAQAPWSAEEVARRAAVIRPAPEDLRWQQVPWLDTLTAGRDAAQKEKRPIFIWAPDDDPFERC